MLDRPLPDPVPSDKEPFPFGIHKKIPYGEVPASYLDHIHGMPWIKDWPRVLAYIEHNRRYIDAELETEERGKGRPDDF